MSLGRLPLAASILVFVLSGLRVQAQDEICIKRYLASPEAKALGIAPAEVETLVAQEANAIGLPISGITIIPCGGTSKVRSNYIEEPDIKGEYILYDPVWVREVLGPDIQEASSKQSWDEATFLFGHELGHLLGRHFTSNANLSRLQKESDADSFAGCASGALGADWPNISAFISRIRSDTASFYPSRSQSLTLAKHQFDQCGARRVAAVQATKELILTSDILKRSIRWYAEKPITDPNADDRRNTSLHSLWLDLDPSLLSQVVAAKWVIHGSNLHYTALRKNGEHLEFPFTAFGCWDLATITVQLANGRPIISDFNECKAQPVATRPGG